MQNRLLTIRLIRLAMVASPVLPCLLFAFGAWTTHRHIDALANERLVRSLDVEQEEATKTFELINLTTMRPTWSQGCVCNAASSFGAAFAQVPSIRNLLNSGYQNAILALRHSMTEEKVKIKCTKCSQVFRERAQKIRDGVQVNCRHCNRLITFDTTSEDRNIRRALASAKEVRSQIEAAHKTLTASA